MPTTTPTTNSERAVRIGEVVRCVGFSRTQIYRLIALGRFPAPVRLSDRISIWRQKDIDEWLSKQFEKSSNLRSADREALLRGHAGASHGRASTSQT